MPCPKEHGSAFIEIILSQKLIILDIQIRLLTKRREKDGMYKIRVGQTYRVVQHEYYLIGNTCQVERQVPHNGRNFNWIMKQNDNQIGKDIKMIIDQIRMG